MNLDRLNDIPEFNDGEYKLTLVNFNVKEHNEAWFLEFLFEDANGYQLDISKYLSEKNAGQIRNELRDMGMEFGGWGELENPHSDCVRRALNADYTVTLTTSESKGKFYKNFTAKLYVPFDED